MLQRIIKYSIKCIFWVAVTESLIKNLIENEKNDMEKHCQVVDKKKLNFILSKRMRVYLVIF